VIDDRGRSAAQLDTGMVVRLRGRSDDGVTGVADRIDVENEARGAIQSIEPGADPQRFMLGGLVVLADDQTVYANLAGFAALAVGTRVEVHGLRDSDGLLHAARVEAVSAQDGADELRAALAGLDTAADRFTLNGSIAVDYAGATFAPGASEASLAAGVVVEVRGTLSGTVFTASRIEIEDLEDEPFRGSAGERQDVEGYIRAFTVHPGAFEVNGRAVRTTATTKFVGGTAADLVNDVKVEVDGVIDAQLVLVAAKVTFRRTRVILQGLATAVDTTARTLVALGQTVRVNDLTRIDARPAGPGLSNSLGDVLANVDCVEARGHMEGARFVAERVRELNQCGADVIQATVSGKDETAATLSFLSGLVAVMPAGAEYYDGAGAPVTRAAFLALVTAGDMNNPGTLVKLRGTFAAGTFTTAVAEVKN
jgi:hypothetical protein